MSIGFWCELLGCGPEDEAILQTSIIDINNPRFYENLTSESQTLDAFAAEWPIPKGVLWVITSATVEVVAKKVHARLNLLSSNRTSLIWQTTDEHLEKIHAGEPSTAMGIYTVLYAPGNSILQVRNIDWLLGDVTYYNVSYVEVYL